MWLLAPRSCVGIYKYAHVSFLQTCSYIIFTWVNGMCHTWFGDWCVTKKCTRDCGCWRQEYITYIYSYIFIYTCWGVMISDVCIYVSGVSHVTRRFQLTTWLLVTTSCVGHVYVCEYPFIERLTKNKNFDWPLSTQLEIDSGELAASFECFLGRVCCFLSASLGEISFELWFCRVHALRSTPQ